MNPDVSVTGSGTIYLVHPLTDAAKQWIEDNVGGEMQYLGNALAVEHRYIMSIIEGMQSDGLIVVQG